MVADVVPLLGGVSLLAAPFFSWLTPLLMAPGAPRVVVHEAPALRMLGAHFPGSGEWAVDCNSPVHWSGDTMVVFSSCAHPWRSEGPDLFSLGEPAPIVFDNEVKGGRWFEATHWAEDGMLYAWYHLEPYELPLRNVSGQPLTAPRIGAARSEDNGHTWHDLGVVLDAPTDTLREETHNHYFAGGNGDFCVIPDRAGEWIYFGISTYGDFDEQGVTLARMSLSDLDDPVGKVTKWRQGGWTEPGLGGRLTPILRATRDWHAPDVDAPWGPSIHYNTHLEQYVMLLNRAVDPFWAQEGVYICFNPDIADPEGWTEPVKILDGVGWYPQIIGLDAAAHETDKIAGRRARLFVSGESRWEIEFLGPQE